MKRSQIILSLLLALSLVGNGYLFYRYSTMQGQYTNTLSEMETYKQDVSSITKMWEESKGLLETELAKSKELEKSIEDLETKLAEAEKKEEVVDVLQPESSTPEIETNPDAPSSSTPESKHSTGIRTSGTVPGATQNDKRWNLKDGEAMRPQGTFIPIDEIYDTCYYKEGGVLYMLTRGQGRVVKDPVTKPMPDWEDTGDDTWG